MTVNRGRVRLSKKDAPALFVLMVVLPLIVGILTYGFLDSHEKSLYRSEVKLAIGYKAASNQYNDDRKEYGYNHCAKAYYSAVLNLKALDDDVESGVDIRQTQISKARKALTVARKDYVSEAKRIEAQREQDRIRKEREEQEALERATEERQQEAAASYVEPEAYRMDISGEMLGEVIVLSAADINKYFGRLGWEEYDEAFSDFHDTASKYLYENGSLVYDGETFTQIYYSVDDVIVALQRLSDARRSMIIQQAGDDSIVMDFSKNQDDPYVYTTETGIRYHWRETCSGLDNANDVFVERRSDAQARGLTECQICY